MIDWARVAELREEVGVEEFDEVVELFLEEVEEVVTRLRTSPEPANYEDDMHFLKGSALNLGFAEFARICQAGETAAASGHVDSVEIAPVLVSYERSKSAFQGGL